MVEVNFTGEALKKLRRSGVKSLSVEVSEEAYEWTPCCGIGDVCVITPLIKVKEEAGGKEAVGLETGEGITVYVEPSLLSKAERVLTIDVDELGKLTVKGLKLKPSFILPQHSTHVFYL
jgi:hypothetical protein